jgi:hypothetical protein
VFYDQEAVVVFLQDGHELKGREGSTHLQLREVSIQATQDTGIVATDEEDLVSLQFQMAVQGIYQHLHRSDQDVECFGEQRDCWVQFNFHDKDMGGYWDMRASCVWSECNEGEMQLRLII